MSRTEDPYTFLEWTTYNKMASSKRGQAMKIGWRQEEVGGGYRLPLLCECVILTSCIIEIASIVIHAISN